MMTGVGVETWFLCWSRCSDVVLQQDMDDLDDDLFKPKKKSTPSRVTSTATPASKPDYTQSEMEYPSTKPKGEFSTIFFT